MMTAPSYSLPFRAVESFVDRHYGDVKAAKSAVDKELAHYRFVCR
ncbi:MAG: hypothetical protein AAGF98_11455 [Cyanobacteria bacterium P01_H01_bin.153]